MHDVTNTLSQRGQEPETNVLYLVGTPIGNLNDISIRAINILRNVSLIACEDTRNTKKLLNYLNISNKLISYHKFNSIKQSQFITRELEKGCSIALVSDAGMPLISDPGDILVKELKEKGFDIICIPGPCAALTGLISSGLDASKFTFYGFLPRTRKERKEALEKVALSEVSTILYESPKRILKLLLELEETCGGDRNIILLKELTKKYEQHFGKTIKNVISIIKDIKPKGEFTVVIGGINKNKINESIYDKSLKKDLQNLIEAGLSHSAASSFLSKKTGKSKKEIYNLILENDLK